MILTNTVLLTGSVYFCEKIAFVLVLLYVIAISGKKNLFRVGNWAFE